MKFTASRKLEEKLELARDLMSHRNPRGDLATIIEAAVDLLIRDALKAKLGVTKRPQKRPKPAKRERVTNATRREVLERDGLGCSFENERGERCGARAFLELDHRKAKGTGGGPEPENMRLLCRAHNQAEAERVYGQAHMERCRPRKRDGEVRERTSTWEFEVGLLHPRRRGYSSSAGRSEIARRHARRFRHERTLVGVDRRDAPANALGPVPLFGGRRYSDDVNVGMLTPGASLAKCRALRSVIATVAVALL